MRIVDSGVDGLTRGGRLIQVGVFRILSWGRAFARGERRSVKFDRRDFRTPTLAGVRV
jgi:hypothetical protein